MIPVDPNATFDHVVADERMLDKADNPIVPEEERAVFHIRPLTLAEEDHLNMKFGKIVQDKEGNVAFQSEAARRTQTILNMGLMGWSNFPAGAEQDEGFEMSNTGNRTKPGSRIIKSDSLDRIPAQYRHELADRITMGLGVTAEDEGKSEQPSE